MKKTIYDTIRTSLWLPLLCWVLAISQPGALLAIQEGPAQSTDADTATFKLFVKGVNAATVQTSLDRSGNYHRSFMLSMGGHAIEMRLDLTGAENGTWSKMEIRNPTFANYQVSCDGKNVRYLEKGDEKIVPLPPDYILYDDYGMLFETVMLRKYDLTKKGKQKFTRFRIPENPMPGNVIEVEVEFLGTQDRAIKGQQMSFLTFSWTLMGVRAIYWLDPDYKLYLIDSPAEQAMSVRKGFEPLMKMTQQNATKADQVVEVTKKIIEVPMRDGVRLATDLYLPKMATAKFPLIILRTPYKKEMIEFSGQYYGSHGYAVAIQDVRGRFASPGEWQPFIHEAEDGYDAIEWLAQQPWCTGQVGMLGGSYLAWAQCLAARLQPPHLRTIIPHNLPADPFFNTPYENGCFFMAPEIEWVELMETHATADISGEKFKQIHNRKYETLVGFLPVIDLDKKIIGKEVPYWREWIHHNSNDAYWAQASYCEKLPDLNIPVFLQSGWFDTQSIGTRLAYEALKSRNRHVKLIMGPWDHVNQVLSTVSTRTVGEEARLDLMELYLRWFDHWLKGDDSKKAEAAPVQLYVLNGRNWLQAQTYPLPQTQFQKLYFSSDQGANTLKGDGKLVWSLAGNGKLYDQYVYDPADPALAPAFRWREGRKSFDAITSQRQDLLVYRSAPLDQPVTLCGPISAILYATSSARDTDWFVTLYALTDKNETVQMVRGAMRARYRNGTAQAEFLEENKIYEYTIDLWHFGIKLDPGWRLCAEISSSYWPQFSRNLNTGGHNELETNFISAEQKIYHSEAYPSHLLLPVIPWDSISKKN